MSQTVIHGRLFRFILLSAALGLTGAASAAERTGDVWLVSTRDAARFGRASIETQPINYWRLDDEHRWQSSSLDAFAAADRGEADPRPTVVFVHGNWETLGDSIRSSEPIRGWLLKQADGRRFRLVIWSWPADRLLKKKRPDLQLKAAYSTLQSRYLAELLTRVDSRADVCLVGYSYGARISAGSLHLLSGGRLGGWGMTAPAPKFRHTGAVFVAAALDAGGLSPCGCYRGVLSQADEILVTRNACDPKLRFYSLLYGCGGPPAMGFTGPWGVASVSLQVLDLSRSVGETHDWPVYAASKGVLDAISRCAFSHQ